MTNGNPAGRPQGERSKKRNRKSHAEAQSTQRINL